MIKLVIHGEPKGQPRARAYAMKFGNKYSARMYDSETADAWKAAVDAALKKETAKDAAPSSLGFGVEMFFYFKRPKSHYKKNGELNSKAPEEKVSRPDADNCVKLILDRVTRCGKVWHDDSQVVRLFVVKSWSEGDSAAYVEIVEWK